MATVKEMRRRDEARTRLEAMGFKIQRDQLYGRFNVHCPVEDLSAEQSGLIADFSLDGQFPIQLIHVLPEPAPSAAPEPEPVAKVSIKARKRNASTPTDGGTHADDSTDARGSDSEASSHDRDQSEGAG